MSRGRGEQRAGAGPVRPYVLTGGRTRATADDLPIETVVRVTDLASGSTLTYERLTIATLCSTPQSIAELAANLDVPLGVARVLVTEMTSDGLLRADATADASDTVFIQHLIEGIRSL